MNWSFQDVGSAVAKLDAVMISVVVMIFVFICLLIFNRKNTLASLVPLATIIVGFSFIFGHSAQTLFESVSFSAVCVGYVDAHGLLAHLHLFHPRL